MGNQFWHVCYVKPKTEKIVQRKIEDLQCEVFLPLVKHQRVYKTAKKIVQLPLFLGYVFVNVESGYRHHITAIPEVYRFIKFREEYAKVSDKEINNLKILINGVKDFSQIDSDIIFEHGKCAEVTDGPFMGMQGIMVKKLGSDRLIIKVEAIKHMISVEIAAKYLKVKESAEVTEPVF